MKPKTVLLVAGAAGFSTRDVWEGYREGLTELGVRVIPYATFSMLRLLSQELVGNDVVGKAHDVRNRIDAVIFVDGLHFQGERSWVPLTVRQSGTLTALVKTDDPYAPIPDAHHLYDVVCNNELASSGDHELYLPTATSRPPELEFAGHPAVDEKDVSDIVFVGTMFEDRLPMLLELAAYCDQHHLRLRLAGNFPADSSRLKRFESVHLTRATVRPEAKWRLYANSRIVLNLFRSADHAISPSPRVFEVTALGRPALLTGCRRSEVTRIYGDSVYEFDDAKEMTQQVSRAIGDESERKSRVAAARQITLGEHLYQHRAETLLSTLGKVAVNKVTIRTADSSDSSEANSARGREMPGVTASAESRLAWIVGCGRTGSTWLCEMLDAIPQMHGWHEPYFGRLLKQLVDQPDESRRPAAFFFDGHRKSWVRGLRDAFYGVALSRYPGFGQQALVVKEVNTPEFFGLIEEIFPSSGLILLLRDPFDVLDSYIDMRKEGSWNRAAGRRFANSPEHLATHIGDSIERAIDAFERFGSDRKIELRYEKMLENPREAIQRCCQLVGVNAEQKVLDEIVSAHQFDTHTDTGAHSFRRFGQARIWEKSGNFDSETTRIAESVLGDLRRRIGYT